jgi:UDPglucose--hexose-1-phosphate uridylyltransferase
MNDDLFKRYPQRRYNPLLAEWVLVSPHRTQRPWQGQVDATPPENKQTYDPECYLCPGNSRAGGARNPDYQSTFVFDNDFSALAPTTPLVEAERAGLLVARTERGICRVACFHPRHDLTIAQMSVPQIRNVVDMWVEEYQQLGNQSWIASVLIFENRGAMMGASNPHPHGQIWANETVPNIPSREQESFLRYRREHGSCLLCRYLETEQQLSERVICSNAHFTVIIPFWALWPFETLLVSNHHLGGIGQLSSEERDALAAIMQQLTGTYDRVFHTPFPYSMGFHQCPTDGQEHSEWHLHAHYFPPLLRSASVRKFMVGYEMLGSPQRDITPEEAAERLRSLLI